MGGLVVPPARRLQELGRGLPGRLSGLPDRLPALADRLPALAGRLSVLLAWRPGLALRPAAVLPAAVPFQDDLDVIIDEPPPRRMRAANLLVASLLAPWSWPPPC